MFHPPRFGPESLGAGPANRSNSASGPSMHRDQERFRCSLVPYLFREDDNDEEEQLCLPPPRSGAASVVLNHKLYIFGGFGGGSGRLDDFYSFDFATSTWEEIKPLGEKKPGCRENNGLVVSSSSRAIILFGGYNGNRWLNDLWSFDVTRNRWTCIQESSDSKHSDITDEIGAGLRIPMAGEGPLIRNEEVEHLNRSGRSMSRKRPCCRFGYVSVTHNNNFILWGGFDGTDWLNDMYIFNFESSKWTEIEQLGTLPSRRSCPAWAKDENFIYLHGGYDGNERKDDFFSFCLDTCTWTQMPNRGNKPSPRYFHSCVLFENKLIMFGGYSGSRRLSDMHTYDFRSDFWSEVDLSNSNPPSGRSSLVAQVYKNHLYVFAGYNGTSVMNDMYKIRLRSICVPPSSFVEDFRRLMNDSDTADVCFLIEGKKVQGHRAVLGVRSQYFHAMFFNGHMCESSNNQMPIEIPDVSYPTFVKVVEFLYTDTLTDVSPELGISILIASELFMLERLKAKCEDIIRREINLENATGILVTSHQHNAPGLKEIALEFILRNLNKKSIQSGLNELKTEPELLLDIIKLTSLQPTSYATTQEENRSPQQAFRSPGSQQGPQDFLHPQHRRSGHSFGGPFGIDEEHDM